MGRLRGYPNNRFPTWFEPTLVDLTPLPFGPFQQSLALTAAGDVVLVPIPGHTPGQMGVVVQESGHRVFLAGDASYSQDLMLEEVVDGVSGDDTIARATLATVHRFVTEAPTVYVVAHDPDSAARLAHRSVIGQGH